MTSSCTDSFLLVFPSIHYLYSKVTLYKLRAISAQKGLSHELLPKTGKYYFFKRKIERCESFLQCFCPIFPPLHGHFFFGGGHFSLASEKKWDLARRSVRQKWVHIFKRSGLWDKLSFFFFMAVGITSRPYS